MSKVNLTEREYEVMEILWRNPKPMLASDIMEVTKSTSNNSVHHILNKLMEKGFVKVAGNVKVVKSQSRLYAPAVSAMEYIVMESDEIFKSTAKKFDLKSFLFCLTKSNKSNKGRNDEIINDIKNFIEEYESNGR
ncbi:MAG: BlaI/MecI/CopY family transcriptional regulator [Clostridia bacterium]|nr:BlaI/MecI/CopY family transcriptional regulator [Clostridia bacterium]